MAATPNRLIVLDRPRCGCGFCERERVGGLASTQPSICPKCQTIVSEDSSFGKHLKPTRIHFQLGHTIDAAPLEPADFLASRHATVLAAADAATAAGDDEYFRELLWDLSAHRIHVPLGVKEPKPVEIYSRESYAFGPGSTEYLLSRYEETADPVLRIRYSEVLLATGPSSGIEWITNMRRVIGAYQEYVAHARQTATPTNVGFTGLHIEGSVERAMAFAGLPGAARGSEPADWAAWIIESAEYLHDFAWKDDPSDDPPEFWSHRYTFPILATLTQLPASAIDQPARELALALVGQAYDYFSAEPLSDHFAVQSAEIEAQLRKHFGESGTYAVKIRRQFDALVRRADQHERTGNGMLTAHFVREAMRLATEHRQLFSEPELSTLRERERGAWEHAAASGEFKPISVSQEVNPDDYDISDSTPEGTVEELITAAVGLVPDPAELHRLAEEMAANAPLASLFPRTSIRGGKVIGEARTEDEKREADLIWHIWMHLSNDVRLYFSVTLRRSFEGQGLTPGTLVGAMADLDLDAGTLEMLERGYERYFADDLISACHILVPRVEDILRRELRQMGIESTQFQRGVDAGPSRTDDVTFGTLLYRSTSDGQTVEALLGTPLFTYVRLVFNTPAGPNYRNEFAHGLARPADCNPTTIAAVTQVLLCLVDLARRRQGRVAG